MLDYSAELIERGLLSEAKGAALEPVFNAFVEDHMLNGAVFNKDDALFDELLEKGYMVNIGLVVSKAWLKDSEDDGIINMFNDYTDYKEGKQYGHNTNLIKWKG